MKPVRTLPILVALLLATLLATGLVVRRLTRALSRGDPSSAPGAANTREEATPRELRDVGVDEHLDGQIPIDTTWKDENDAMPSASGTSSTASAPPLLTFAYFSCAPTLCSLILSSTAEALSRIELDGRQGVRRRHHQHRPARDAGGDDARTSSTSLIAQYGPEAGDAPANGWHFLRRRRRRPSIAKRRRRRRLRVSVRRRDRSSTATRQR